MASELPISIVHGKEAPRYHIDVKELTITRAVITAHGMESGRPLVDIQMTDKFGRIYWTAISGALVAMLGNQVIKTNKENGGEDYSLNTYEK